MLWDSVYSFFVIHIFGGNIGNITYHGLLGSFDIYNGGTFVDTVTESTGTLNYFYITNAYGYRVYMLFGNYLSLIATIITMVIIVTLCALLVTKIVKLVGGLITR